MSPRSRRSRIITWVVVSVGIFGVIVCTFVLLGIIKGDSEKQRAKDKVWNEVSYPQGNVGVVEPNSVRPGETLVITYKEYCNRGVSVVVTRWVDFLGPNNQVYASFGLMPIEFNRTDDLGCIKNLQQNITIPSDLTGRPDGANKVRLRTVTTYKKPEQVIQVPAFSEPFLLLSAKEPQ